jgi:hypothetical protein
MNLQPISITQHYKSSARIDSKQSNYQPLIDDFILHGTALNVLDTLSQDFSGSQQRAYTLTGPYGSGKSTLALYLSSLLSSKKKEREYASAKLYATDTRLNDFSSRFKVKNGWGVVKHVCGLESPANAILASIYTSLAIDFDFDKVNSFDDEQCLKEIEAALSLKNKRMDGILLLLDEMGKALDFQSRTNKDLHLFQSLADIAQQVSRPVILMGFLHQSFSDYAKSKDAKTQQEWAKVQGRYRDISFNPSIDESLVLVGDSITKQDAITKKLESKYKNLIRHVLHSFEEQSRNEAALTKTLPLDPLVSMLLGPISRRRFSQNERSLFGFLASHEKLGFREFLTENYIQENSSFELYHPEKLWDYLHHNLHHLIVTSPDSKAWLEGCDAIYRASQKGSVLHVSITKVIALLTIFGFHHQLHAKKDFINSYFFARGFKEEEIQEAIDELENWTVVIYRQKHDALFVFQGSDIDINSMVLERIESISEGVDWTSICDIPQNVLATAHYHKFGTMRWATTRLISEEDDVLFSSLDTPPITGETFLYFILPATQTIAKKLASKAFPFAAIGKISSLDTLRSVAIELIALTQVSKQEEKINHDLIAKNELANRIQLANQNIENELNLAFRNASWSYQGKTIASQPLSITASQIANKIFHASPSVINELVNRSKPSGSANSALRKLMNVMLENGDKEDLGFNQEKFPPEKGLYLSCLKSKGWHYETDEGFTFPNQWSKEAIKANPKMHALREDGVQFIKRSQNMVTLDELYSHWMKPPFGLTAGLCRIFGLALLKSLEGQVAFYDLDSTKQFVFIPELDEELITKIYKHPKEAGVRYFEITEIQTHLLSSLAKATIGSDSKTDVILAIAQHIVKIVHTLPAWVKKTSGESFSHTDSHNGLTKEARAFRNKVLSANDPYQLILNDLPNIFQLKKDDADLDSKLSHHLQTAIEDLSAQHDALLRGFKLIIETGLSTKLDNNEFKDDLLSRCKIVKENAQRPSVQELASRLINYINEKKEFEHIISLAVGTSEKNWTDKHLMSGMDELLTLCTQFRRIESFSNIKGQKIESKPLALITSDKSGNYHEYSGFIKFSLENDSEVISALDSVKSTLDYLPKEKQLATLTHLLSTLMEQSGEKSTDV